MAGSLAAAVVLFALGVLLGRLTAPDAGDEAPATVAAPIAAAPTPTTLPATPASSVAPAPAAAGPAATPAGGSPPPAAARAAGRVVCLDPGHGGMDLGNVRLENDEVVLQEKDLTLQVALDLEQRLRQAGIEVVMTRRDDVRVNADNVDVNGDGEVGEETTTQLDDLQARIAICNLAAADLLVSVHFNSAENTALEGYEVWYTADRPFGERSERFARLMHDELAEEMAEAGYEAFSRGWADDTVEEGVVSTLRNYALTGPEVPGKINEPSAMPGAIVEALFLSNDEDYGFITSDGALDAITTAYEDAILAYFAEFPE